MLLECGHCGAPLDVRPNQPTSKCRYCGTTSRVDAMRTIAQKTPKEFKPPKRWRPPPHVPAPSDHELAYKGNGVLIFFGVLFAIIGGGVLFGISRNGGIVGPSPETLGKVRFDESPQKLDELLGGQKGNDGKWLRITARSPFEYAVFQYDDKDLQHPSSVSVHTNVKACTPELLAIREKLAADLGPRFEGTSWSFGPIHVYFDEKCGHVGMHASIDDATKADWRPAIETLWKVFRADVFGVKPVTLTDEERRGWLGRGYEPKTIAAAIADSTIDDVEAVKAKLPGSSARNVGSVSLTIPIEHPSFGDVEVSWKNQKRGGMSSLYFRPFKKGIDPPTYAKCLASKLPGAKLDIRETDYVKKQTNATVAFGATRFNVSSSIVNAYPSQGDTIDGADVKALLGALPRCE